MAGGSAKVLTQVLKLIDNHDLYGSVAYPKRHTQKDISDIYRLSLATHGVFTNVALQEPFGLTVIEVACPFLLSHLLILFLLCDCHQIALPLCSSSCGSVPLLTVTQANALCLDCSSSLAGSSSYDCFCF